MAAMPPPPPGGLKENTAPGGASAAGIRRSTRQSVLTNQNQVPQTPMGLKTPAFDPRLPQTPACTPGGRLPRRGESLMSANGSPLAIFAGARATFGLNAEITDEPVIQVALDNGEEINCTLDSAAEMGAEARDEARGKLQMMQDQLAALLKAMA